MGDAKARKSSVWPWLVCGLLGLAIGTGSALALSGGALSAGNIMVGRWSSDPNVGARAANPWLRARIARVGLLGLTKSETMYFDRTTDEAGNPLRDTCVYRLSGVAMPTRWWSMTIYGSDEFLPRNEDGASSIDATRALVAGQTTWEGTLSHYQYVLDKPWLSSKGAGTFSVTLRLYNPSTTDPRELRQMSFPKIELKSCENGSSPPGANP
jgi:hypothetical protein